MLRQSKKEMFKYRKLGIILGLIFYFLILNINCSVSAQTQNPYPDYATEFLGQDKYEKFNRKMFNFNMKMNKYAIRPLHIIWASIMPKYAMDRIDGIYNNILYPRRLVSNLIQKDFKGAKNETIRFFTNTTLGLGGMFDVAKRYLDIESQDADMEQALAKCNVKSGSYVVCPILSSSSPRGLVGKALDAALDPSSYLGLPFMSFIKAGLMLNNTYSMQPMSYFIEETYADPYDIIKKLYGLENYLKVTPSVEKEVLKTMIDVFDGETGIEFSCIPEEYLVDVTENIILVDDYIKKEFKDLNDNNIQPLTYVPEEKLDEENISADDDILAQELLAIYGYFSILDDAFLNINNEVSPQSAELSKKFLEADMILENYNPQSPVLDAMRTILFDSPEINKSIWSEFSLWNRSFSKRIKMAQVNIFPKRDDYKFRFIMQKDKNAPVAIIYPSIGEGIMSNHSVVMAKLFYDKGYSVIIQGNHFQWAFLKSMPDGYRPGLPSSDAEYLKLVTTKIVNYLQDKYNCEFRDKVLIGTSFGAMTTLFLADKESRNNTLNISKFISINPPIELIYAMTQIDNNTEKWHENTNNLKERVANTASKVLSFLQDDTLDKSKINELPFDEEEAKFITGFIMHQKLSDLIYTIENENYPDKSELYAKIRTMNFREYAKKYLLNNEYKDIESLNNYTSLHLISNFLKSNKNYVIYHSMDDYLVNSSQLSMLKNYCDKNLILLNNGSHLGFLYRKEFINSLKNEIPEIKNNTDTELELIEEIMNGV